MNLWHVLGGIAALCTIAAFLYGNIDSRIDRKIKDPEFIEMIAKQARPALLVFDEYGHYHLNKGGSEYIKSVTVLKDKEDDIIEIQIFTKRLLNPEPFITAIGGPWIEFLEPQKLGAIDLSYKAVTNEITFGGKKGLEPGQKIIRKFKLEIIEQ
jgi:hypothetical protein